MGKERKKEGICFLPEKIKIREEKNREKRKRFIFFIIKIWKKRKKK